MSEKKKFFNLVKTEKEADLTIFGDITSLRWFENDVSSYSLSKQLEDLDVDNINVHINSYGGEVAEALAIANTLMKHKATVTTYVEGFACSAATIIFMAGDRRVVSKYSNFLVHPAWASIEGNAEELRKEANNLDAITENSVQLYVSRTGKSRDQIVSLMAEERFLTPEETFAWGFATEIEDPADSDKANQSVEKLVYDKLHEKRRTLKDIVIEEMENTVRKVVQECVAVKAPDPETPDSDTEKGASDTPNEGFDPETDENDTPEPDAEPAEEQKTMSILEQYRAKIKH